MNTEAMIRKLNEAIGEHEKSYVPVCLTNTTAVYRDILPMLEKLKRYEDSEEQGKFKTSVSEYRNKELESAKETIRKLLCGEYGSSCQFCIQDGNENAMCRKIGGSGSWCCKNARWNGRTE